jgi:hypothetical protein
VRAWQRIEAQALSVDRLGVVGNMLSKCVLDNLRWEHCPRLLYLGLDRSLKIQAAEVIRVQAQQRSTAVKA